MSKLGSLAMKIRNRLLAKSRLMTQKSRKRTKTSKELNNPSRKPLRHLTIWCFEDSLRFDRSQPYPKYSQLPRATGPGEMKGLTASTACVLKGSERCSEHSKKDRRPHGNHLRSRRHCGKLTIPGSSEVLFLQPHPQRQETTGRTNESSSTIYRQSWQCPPTVGILQN
jgi:hypothetical protein